MKKVGLLVGVSLAIAVLSGCSSEDVPDFNEMIEDSPVSTFISEEPSASEPTDTAPPAVSDMETMKLLDSLTVAEKAHEDEYERPNLWGAASTYHVDAPLPSNCDVREAVLYRDGENVKVDDDCKILQGKWVDPYNNITYTYNLDGGTPIDVSDLEIEHIVPLKNAFGSGAYKWMDETFKTFAHDVNNLIVVNGSDNASKGAKGPEEWVPSNEGYTCSYATKWIETKTEYELTVTENEKIALREMLSTCEEGN